MRMTWQKMPACLKVHTHKGNSEEIKQRDALQRMPAHITAQTDSDWAACRLTRKSVTGGVLYHGNHMIRTWSKEQSTIATSSAEAELYAANYGGQQALGLQSIAKDFNMDASIDLEMDASAAIGILERRGLGKMRHLDVAELWLQEQVRRKRIRLVKIPGLHNAADLGTKPLSAEHIEKHMRRIGVY